MSVRKKIEAKFRAVKAEVPVSAGMPAPQINRPAAASSGIPAEVVAAIAGAVSMMCGEGAVVTGIRPVRRSASGRGRSEWSAAGLLEATRPF